MCHVGARAFGQLTLFDQVIDCFGSDDGDIEGFAGLDLFLHAHGGVKLHSQRMADRALALRLEFHQGGLHAVGNQDANRRALRRSLQCVEEAECNRNERSAE